MPTIINQESFGGNLGRNLGQTLGQGLSSGLQQLANQKLERMHKKSIQHDLRSAFPEIPEEAIAFIANKPAKEQLQILEMLGQQRQQQQEQQAMGQQQQQASGLQQLQQPQESMQQQDVEIPDDHYTPEVIQHLEEQLSSPEAAQQFPPEELQRAKNNLLSMQQKLMQNPVGVNPFPKEPTQPNQIAQPVTQPKESGIPLETFAKGSKDTLAREKQALAREKFEFEKKNVTEKPKNAAQIKQEEALVADANQLSDIINTTKRMKMTLDSEKVSPGIIPQGLSRIAPTLLGAENEMFDKDSSHILNLYSSQQKGQQSKYRLQTLEREKPGLGHSVKVNREIVNRINQEAEHKLKSLLKRYPKLELSDEVVESLLPDPSEYSEDTIIQAYGKTFSKGESGEWQLV